MRRIHRSRWHEIGLSWWSLKRWVKWWLWWLNAVLLASFFWRPDPLATWVLIAYGVSGLLLVPLVWWQRGLTRLLGIGHVIPWTPLVGYLLLRLTTARVGPRIIFAAQPWLWAYCMALLASLMVCLGFDLWDVKRWLGGERYRLGSRAAAADGASALTLSDA